MPRTVERLICLFLISSCAAGDTPSNSAEQDCHVSRLETMLTVLTNLLHDTQQMLIDNFGENSPAIDPRMMEHLKSKRSFQRDLLTVPCSKGHSRRPRDCMEVQQEGGNVSGVYEVWPRREQSLKVYCDMDTEGGGWTVIQRRGQFGNPIEYFDRGWSDFRKGFGNLEKEFWLGNEAIHQLTSKDNWELRVDLWSKDGEQRFAKYLDFWLGSEQEQYTLHLDAYNGSAGDSLLHHRGFMWTTKDRKNDRHGTNCAIIFRGAWWHYSCHQSNLNGLNRFGHHESFADGINWKAWTGYHESLARTEMKIRPQNTVSSF